MNNIFNKLDEDYVKLLQDFNPAKPTSKENDIIKLYHTPSRNYITASARGISSDSVGSSTLGYIITECYKCSIEEKYKAILVFLNKLYTRTTDIKEVEKVKKELVQYLDTKEPTSRAKSLSYIDDYTNGYEKNFFYLVEFTIGKNKLIKYGITNKQPRLRFAQIKSDIKSNYSNFKIDVEPLMIIHCENSERFEDEIKMLVSEYDLKQTNYSFKGSSETLNISTKTELVHSIIEPTITKYKAKLLYSKKAK